MLEFDFDFRLLNEAEKNVIFNVLKPYGFRYEGDGSRVTTNDGRVVYNISFHGGSVATLDPNLEKKLCNALNADECNVTKLI